MFCENLEQVKCCTFVYSVGITAQTKSSHGDYDGDEIESVKDRKILLSRYTICHPIHSFQHNMQVFRKTNFQPIFRVIDYLAKSISHNDSDCKIFCQHPYSRSDESQLGSVVSRQDIFITPISVWRSCRKRCFGEYFHHSPMTICIHRFTRTTMHGVVLEPQVLFWHRPCCVLSVTRNYRLYLSFNRIFL